MTLDKLQRVKGLYIYDKFIVEDDYVLGLDKSSSKDDDFEGIYDILGDMENWIFTIVEKEEKTGDAE